MKELEENTFSGDSESAVSDDKEMPEESSTSSVLPELPSLQPAGEQKAGDDKAGSEDALKMSAGDDLIAGEKISDGDGISDFTQGHEQDSPEIRLRNSQNMLRLHSFEKEFISFEENAGQKVIVISDGKKMFRKYFDSNQRLVKKEEWKPGSSISSINIFTEISTRERLFIVKHTPEISHM